jgi:hypothetical protein
MNTRPRPNSEEGMKNRCYAAALLGLLLIGSLSLSAQPQARPPQASDEQKILDTMHSITSFKLFDYEKELCSEKYSGRLTGTAEFNTCADWVISLLKKWGVAPAGDKGTYLQAFPDPYTLVFPGGMLSLNLTVNNEVIKKYYRYPDEFVPGSTSGSGEVTAEVVYVGYGITAPELGYDDYQGVDVKGKIVLMDPEVPVQPDANPDLFKKWRPYSFHQYKLDNAVTHGAKGMIYNYGPLGNPNNSYKEGFIYHHVGRAVVNDVFAGTGKTYNDIVARIRRELKPQSFATGKTMTIKNVTEHHPEGIGYNVIGVVPGSDPKLKDEVLIIGAHLDHLGRDWDLMPGANDNASAVSVGLGVAEAMAKSPIKPRRTVMFLFFGAEEQGVAGSDFYCEHPSFPLDKTVGLLNMDMVGAGDRISASAGRNFPAFWAFIEKANEKYIHRQVFTNSFSNLARPRLDAARFLWKGVPSLSFAVSGKPAPYHLPSDNLDVITPDILEDMGRLLFIAGLDIANQDAIDFRTGK